MFEGYKVFGAIFNWNEVWGPTVIRGGDGPFNKGTIDFLFFVSLPFFCVFRLLYSIDTLFGLYPFTTYSIVKITKIWVYVDFYDDSGVTDCLLNISFKKRTPTWTILPVVSRPDGR